MENEGTFWVDEEEGVLVIKDNDGNEDKYIIEEKLEVSGNTYLIIIPEEMIENEDAEAFVLKIAKEGDEETLSVVDDDAEFEMVRESYLKL